MSNENILRKIRGLLAKAEDTAVTAEEAQSYAEAAERLIGKYAIATALLAEDTGTRGKPTMRTFTVKAPYEKAKGTLLGGIALAHACKVIRTHEGYVVVGFESDLDLVDMLYTSLLLQGASALNREYHSDRSFRTSFWYGFANRVYARLKELRASLETASEPGTALVLRDRSKDVEVAFKEAFPRTKSVSRGAARNARGWNTGKAAANNADLGGTRLGGKVNVLA